MLVSFLLTAVAFVGTARRQLGEKMDKKRSKSANHNNTVLKIGRQSHVILKSHYFPFVPVDLIFS